MTNLKRDFSFAKTVGAKFGLSCEHFSLHFAKSNKTVMAKEKSKYIPT